MEPRPGDIVVTNIGVYQHWSLVTDRRCDQGQYMLISASRRTGTVKEEPWHLVTRGNASYVAQMRSSEPVERVLARARSRIDNWQYSVLGNNCEHFVTWVTRMQPGSRQVRAGVSGALGGAFIARLVAGRLLGYPLLGGALTLGALAITLVRATKRRV